MKTVVLFIELKLQIYKQSDLYSDVLKVHIEYLDNLLGLENLEVPIEKPVVEKKKKESALSKLFKKGKHRATKTPAAVSSSKTMFPAI